MWIIHNTPYIFNWKRYWRNLRKTRQVRRQPNWLALPQPNFSFIKLPLSLTHQERVTGFKAVLRSSSRKRRGQLPKSCPLALQLIKSRSALFWEFGAWNVQSFPFKYFLTQFLVNPPLRGFSCMNSTNKAAFDKKAFEKKLLSLFLI